MGRFGFLLLCSNLACTMITSTTRTNLKSWHNYSNHYVLLLFLQRRIQGRGPGGPGPTPLFVDQTEARRAEKNFFWRPAALLPHIRGMTALPPISRSRSSTGADFANYLSSRSVGLSQVIF